MIRFERKCPIRRSLCTRYVWWKFKVIKCEQMKPYLHQINVVWRFWWVEDVILQVIMINLLTKLLILPHCLCFVCFFNKYCYIFCKLSFLLCSYIWFTSSERPIRPIHRYSDTLMLRLKYRMIRYRYQISRLRYLCLLHVICCLCHPHPHHQRRSVGIYRYFLNNSSWPSSVSTAVRNAVLCS